MEDHSSSAPRVPRTDPATLISRRSLVKVEIMLFLGLWLVYGLLINQKNIGMYGQSMTEAFVDKKRVSVESLTAWPWEYVGDVFHLDGHTYSNKNPGQAIISSIAYIHLKFMGISYSSDKYLAGALVIFFSTSLLTALGAVALYRLARDLAGRRTVIWPLAAALVWSVCTTQMAWAGVAWHDPLAAPMIVIGFYLIQRVRNGAIPHETARTYSFVAAFLLGMTVTTSGAFLSMAVIFGIYFLTMRRWNLLLPFFTGGVLGIAPLLLYNTIFFGSPHIFAYDLYFKLNAITPDIYLVLDWSNFTKKASDYYGLITSYAPILWIGLAGLLFLPSKFRREQLTVFAAILVLILYMFNITGLGVCGYGPRYLLPIMPFCSLGIVGLASFPTKTLRVLLGGAVFLVAFVSFRVNFVGAFGGALYCPVYNFAYPEYVQKLLTGPMPEFPLFTYLFPLFLVLCIWAIYSQSIVECYRSEFSEP